MLEPDTLGKMDNQIAAVVQASPYGKKLLDIIAHRFGPRPPASAALKKASAFLADELGRMGAKNIHTEDVPILAWQHEPSHVELIRPERRLYDSVQHMHSTSANVEAAVFNARDGAEEQLDELGDRIPGAILLMCGRTITGQKYVPKSKALAQAGARGAAAVLVRNMYLGIGPAIEMATGRAEDIGIPVVGLSSEDADELGSLMTTGNPIVRIATSGKSYRATCSNLVAELGPAEAAGEVVILSAHLDSHATHPGAFDNLTGVVTLIEIARALAPQQEQFRRTLRLILFTGEEHGFMGSKAYVQQHTEQLDGIRFVFNMDALFSSTAKAMVVMWATEMRDYIDQIFRRVHGDVDVQNQFCMSSDYLPFLLAGIAAARPADCKNPDHPYPNISHTWLDTPERVPPEWIRLNALNYARMLGPMLADPQPLPTQRKTRAQVQALIAQADAADALWEYGWNADGSLWQPV